MLKGKFKRSLLKVALESTFKKVLEKVTQKTSWRNFW